MGLIHTIAPPTMRQEIAMSAVAPTQAWDALICTSPSVQSAMTSMFDEMDGLSRRSVRGKGSTSTAIATDPPGRERYGPRRRRR